MKPLNSRILSTIAGCLAVFLSASPAAVADDSEVFTSASFTAGAGVRPNVLFIIDTSGSMDGAVNVYDGSVTYSGSCDTTLIYWQTDNSSRPPECTTNQTLTTTANRCQAGYAGMLANGWWRGRVQQLNSSASAWQTPWRDSRTVPSSVNPTTASMETCSAVWRLGAKTNAPVTAPQPAGPIAGATMAPTTRSTGAAREGAPTPSSACLCTAATMPTGSSAAEPSRGRRALRWFAMSRSR